MNVSNKIILSLKILCIGFLLFASEKIFAAEQFNLAVCPGKAAYYFAEHDIMKGDSSLKYAVIYIHGAKGGAKDAAALMRRKLKKYKAEEKVYCIAPSFFTKKTCPEDKKNDALLWERGWRGGASAINGNKISNYFNIKILGEKNILNVQKYLTRGTAIIVTGHYFRDSWKAGNEYKEFNYILCEKWEFQIGKANDNESTPVNIPEVPATNQETTHTPEEPAPEPQEEQGGFMNIPEGIDDDLMDLPFRG